MADEKTPSPTGSTPSPEEPVVEERLPESLHEVRVKGRSLRTWVLGAGALALAVSAAFGGLKKAPEEVPHVEPGTAIAAGKFDVTIDRAVVVKDLKPVFRSDDGGFLLAVVAKVKLTDDLGDMPALSLLKLVDVPGIPAGARPMGTANMRDSTMNPILQPNQPENVVYVWKLPKATAVPAEVHLEVEKTTYDKESNLTHYEVWRTDGIAGETVVKVKNNLKAAQ